MSAQSLRSGHLTIGSSGHRKSNAFDFRSPDDPITRWPDYNSLQGQSMNPTHPESLPVAAAQLPAVPLTLEGYATLHQMMRFRWTAWRALAESARHEIAAEAASLLAAMEAKADGQSALFSLLGHKGDLMLVHFRETFDQLNQAELDLAR